METVKPSKKELSQVYYIEREIKNLQRLIDNYADTEIQSPRINGMPPANTNFPGKPTEESAVRLADLQEQLEELQDKCREARQKIMFYISHMEDSFMRQIVMMRCIEMMSWKDVASHIGGNNTAESCRVAFYRAFD